MKRKTDEWKKCIKVELYYVCKDWYKSWSQILGHTFLQKWAKLRNFSDSAGWSQISLKNQTKLKKNLNQTEISNLKNLGLKKLVTRKIKRLITARSPTYTTIFPPVFGLIQIMVAKPP